jgi:hypothetical protein
MVSIYKEYKKVGSDSEITEVFESIKKGDYKDDINSIRYAVHSEDFGTADVIKNGLVAFTTSGTFGSARTKENITSYSKMICLDFDKLTYDELQETLTIIKECSYTYAAFISPSGNGIKVIVKVNSEKENHEVTYTQVAEYYKTLTGIGYDKKCKDISRLCFISFDEDLYINDTCEIFNPIIEIKQEEFKKEPTNQYQSTDEILDKCLKFTEQKEQYSEGNRNNFIYLFASNANRFGINEDDTLNFCTTNFDLKTREIESAVRSAYKHQSADFAKFAKFANLQSSLINTTVVNTENTFDDYEDCLKATPIIPLSVYENLPPILFESCQVFKNERERDTFLTGALAILSGCLPNVSGIYSGSVIYPSLFSFILAPAASGKGALKFAKALADKYHDKTLAISMEDKKKYEENLAAYKMLKSKGKLEPGQEMPQAPKFKVVYIPANTSNAKIIQHLDCNEGKGIICETEADTLGQTFKNEWGTYSDMLRKSFHHEKISVSRKTDGEFVEVNNPQLAVALSGTPKQIFNVISSAEDGLFSRFIFYVFKTEAVWLDPSPKGNPVNLTDYFTTQSKLVLKLVEFYETDEMILHLTDEQWERFNPIFSSFLEQINTFVSEDALSIVKRLGLILYRFCMIFTAIRKFVTNEHHKEVYCLDIDFETALTLTKTYIQHSIIMFTNLPKQGEQGPFKSGQNKKLFFDALPSKFQRKEAIEIGKRFDIGERSVGNFLKSCLGKYLEQPEYGKYEKIN